ncbi:MAG TPA: hypothetical protein PKY87_17460, partial [Terricaulis sp.]|nr:hypothetical protein [Terricaulis sp.]
GLAPAIAFTGNAQAQPGAGALTFTGFAPAVNTGQEIAAPATGRLTFTGHLVSLDQTANSRITPHALDEAARIIGEALEIDVAREPIGALDEDEDEDGVRLVAALSEGAQTELGYAMGGGYRSFEFEQRAAFELLAVGGDEDQRRARVSRALVAASNAIAANRRLGGLVDHADLEQPDPTDEVRYAALAAVLVLTFTAPTALG